MEENQISREEAFACFWTDEDLHDVALKGTDGVCVGANRWALAARSDVFKKMLTGKYREAVESVVEVGFEGCILKNVVEFVFTDGASLIVDFWKGKKCNDLDMNDFDHVKRLVSLLDAANYFNLPGLHKKAFACLDKAIKDTPSLSLVAFEAAGEESHLRGLWDIASTIIRTDKSCISNATAVAILSPNKLRAIIKDKNVALEEYDLFRMLEIWAHHANHAPAAEADAASTPNPLEDRKSVATELMKYLDLEKIDPLDLKNVVASSFFVTKEQLYEAFQSQAIAAREGGNISFKRRRLSPVWDCSESEDLFNDDTAYDNRFKVGYIRPEILSGRHQWNVEVLEMPSHCSNLRLSGANVGLACIGTATHWIYTSKGRTYIDQGRLMRHLPKFGKGSKVTMTLNLLPDAEEDGSLSVSVDGGAAFILFTGLKSHMEKSGCKGFLPSASLCGLEPGHLRILNMEQL